MHDELVRTLGVDPSRTVYLDDTGHMSGVDPLLALDRAARAGELSDGDLVLLLAAAPATPGPRCPRRARWAAPASPVDPSNRRRSRRFDAVRRAI
jgi:3-oxoacyl-[acyl-carrier-protein] synthase-3